jgi:Holliday junction DNA helicase RuvA
MIAKLAGIIEQIEPDAAVIDVNGVGYLAFCSTRTIGRLPPPGSPARLLIETHVREDHIHLYGFIDAAEILAQDKPALAQAEGVGPRLAARIVNELRDKIGKLAAPVSAPLSVPANGQGATADAIAALENLGVGRSEALSAIAAVARRLGSEAAADVLIKAGLEELMR